MDDVSDDHGVASFDLAAELRRADWDELLPELLAYARRRLRKLGWGEGVLHRPQDLEAEELVNEAIAACLAGDRTVSAPRGTTLVRYLCGAMRSVSSNARRSARSQRASEVDLDTCESDEGSAEDRAEALSLLQQVEAAIAGDPDCVALYEAMRLGSTKREDVAEELGWSPQRAKVARNKIARRLAAAGIESPFQTRSRSPRSAARSTPPGDDTPGAPDSTRPS